jgi:hypothetical protein
VRLSQRARIVLLAAQGLAARRGSPAHVDRQLARLASGARRSANVQGHHHA